MYENSICPACKEECKVIPLDNAFNYSGTHCTGGRDGIYYPSDYGAPVSECCEVIIEDAIKVDY